MREFLIILLLFKIKRQIKNNKNQEIKTEKKHEVSD